MSNFQPLLISIPEDIKKRIDNKKTDDDYPDISDVTVFPHDDVNIAVNCGIWITLTGIDEDNSKDIVLFNFVVVLIEHLLNRKTQDIQNRKRSETIHRILRAYPPRGIGMCEKCNLVRERITIDYGKTKKNAIVSTWELVYSLPRLTVDTHWNN